MTEQPPHEPPPPHGPPPGYPPPGQQPGNPWQGQPPYGQGAPAPGYGPPPGYPQPGWVPPPQAYGYPPDAGAPYGRDAYGRPLSDKSKLVAGLLQILLGGLGIGRFYTGDTGLAVGQLLVTLFTCGIGGVWGVVDGILILVKDDWTDARGLYLRAG